MNPIVITPASDPLAIITHLALIDKTTDPDVDIVVVAYGEHTAEVVQTVETVRIDMKREVALSYVAGEKKFDLFESLNMAAMTEAQMDKETEQRPYYAIVSEDTRMFPGWLDGLANGLKTRKVLRTDDASGKPRKHYGTIGLVGPVSAATTCESQFIRLDPGEMDMLASEYGARREEHFDGQYSQAESLDWRCMVISGSLFRILASTGRLFTPEHGRFVGDDLALRAAGVGQRCVVAESVFVGSVEMVSSKMDVPPDATDRLLYYNKWLSRTREPKIVFFTIARFQQLPDLTHLRRWVERHSKLCDGIEVVIGNNPMDLQHAQAYDNAKLSVIDRKLLNDCDNQGEEAVCEAVRLWLVASVPEGFPVRVHIWIGLPDRKAEINYAIVRAEEVVSDVVGPTDISLNSWLVHIDQDELIEPRVTRAHMDRLACHPNPLVSAWDFGMLTHWETSQMIREDAPFGDGGTYKGGQHAVRMWRVGPRRICAEAADGGVPAAPAFGSESVRTAGMRVRIFGMMTDFDRARRAPMDDKVEGMRLTRFNPKNGVGLHMLCYHRERAEDLARWLDDVHGLIDEAVIVWTDPPEHERSAEWDATVKFFQATWVTKELNDHIAEARNAGIDALRKNERLGWALFFDPDEWMGDRAGDCMAVRRMADSPRRCGWLLKVANPRADDGVPTISDNVRMSRLDGDVAMRMTGRVHEGFSDSIKMMQEMGIHPGLFYAPFTLQHRGMAFGEARMGDKLEHYEKLLRLELDEHPHSPGAWVSLGFHYANDGHTDLAVQCYGRAILCSGQSYLPFKEMAFFHLREARWLMESCRDRLVDTHPFTPVADRIGTFLQAYAPPHPVIDHDRSKEPAPLPDFPPIAAESEGAG